MTSTRFWRPADLGKHKGLGEVFSLTRSWNLVSVILRDRSLFTAWGKGGRRIFVATTEHLRDPPLKHTVWFWSPQIGGGRFHDPTSSIPATTKSQCYYNMQASDIHINTYVSWTLNNNFTYLVIWYKSLKTKSLSLSSPTLWNSSSYSSSSDSPSLSQSLAPHDLSVFIDSLMCR